MRFLVTGASGFIGSQVVRLLVEQGHETFALVRLESDLSLLGCAVDKCRVLQRDLNDYRGVHEALKDIPVDTCIHLAWYAEPGKYLHSDKNLDCISATFHLAYHLALSGCKRFVGIGSCFEYDLAAGTLSEDSPEKPTSLYASSKLAAKAAVESVARTSNMQACWVRLFYQYGPGEDSRRLVPSVILSLLKGESADVSPGEQKRDYLYVEDVASAICSVAQSDLTGVVNVGSGRPVAIRELVTEIATQLGCLDRVRFGAIPYREGEPMLIGANNTRLATQTGWKEECGLREGVRKTIDWFGSRMDRNA